MQNLLTLLLILTPLFVGYFLPTNDAIKQASGKLLSWLVFVILTFIGLEIAQIKGLFEQLDDIFGYVLVLSILTIASGLIAVALFDKLQPWQRPSQCKAGKPSISVKGSMLQIGCIFIGIAIGQFLPSAFYPPEFTMTALLMLLILLVGIDLRSSGILIKDVLVNKRGVQISIIYIVSILLSGLLYSVIFPEVPTFQALALVSGFGWYSLSAIIMTESYGAIWGSIAMINDLTRELFSLVFIPLIIGRFPSAGLSVGGATSLDFTLPVIQQSGGNDIVPTTISFGFIINIAAPILMVGFASLSG